VRHRGHAGAYGHKSSKLITKPTLADQGDGAGSDGWPHYSASGDPAGDDHPFEFPDEVRKIKGGRSPERCVTGGLPASRPARAALRPAVLASCRRSPCAGPIAA
jgi:hypothetical protein